MDIYFSQGNKHERIELEKMGQKLEGILCGDKGYLNKNLHEKLAKKNLKVATRIRRNMKKRNLASEKNIICVFVVFGACCLQHLAVS